MIPAGFRTTRSRLAGADPVAAIGAVGIPLLTSFGPSTGSPASSALPGGECPTKPLCGSDATQMQGKTIDFGY